jgi:hypothetical protein
METLPLHISLTFGITTLISIWIFYKATQQSILTLSILTGWIILQTFIAKSGFYLVTNTFPPRFLLLVLPPLLFIILLFLLPKGRKFLDSLDPKMLTLLHIVRIPVELVLFWLFLHKTVPQLMTFEGRNFDILSGLTAPFIFYFGFVKRKLNRKLILAWNFICLLLLLNIVVNAIFSAPFPFQKFAFDQPNIAILYFPFIWLPCCVVPLVLLSHLASIRKLLKTKDSL